MPDESRKESTVNLHGFGELDPFSGHVTCGSPHTFQTKEQVKIETLGVEKADTGCIV